MDCKWFSLLSLRKVMLKPTFSALIMRTMLLHSTTSRFQENPRTLIHRGACSRLKSFMVTCRVVSESRSKFQLEQIR